MPYILFSILLKTIQLIFFTLITFVIKKSKIRKNKLYSILLKKTMELTTLIKIHKNNNKKLITTNCIRKDLKSQFICL